MSDEGPSNCLSVGGVCYCIGRLPRTQRVALYLHEPGMDSPIAYFQREEDAERFRAWLIGTADIVRAIKQERDDIRRDYERAWARKVGYLEGDPAVGGAGAGGGVL